MNKHISAARLCVNFELNPEDYLDCTNEDDLKDAIFDHMYGEIDYGDICIYKCSTELEGFEEFYECWKKLKEGVNII